MWKTNETIYYSMHSHNAPRTGVLFTVFDHKGSRQVIVDSKN